MIKNLQDRCCEAFRKQLHQIDEKKLRKIATELGVDLTQWELDNTKHQQWASRRYSDQFDMSMGEEG